MKMDTYHTLFAAIAFCVGQLIHERVPILTSGELDQNDEGIGEVLEVVLGIKIVLKHNATEQVQAKRRKDEEHQEDQLHNVRDLRKDVQDCVQDQPHVNGGADQFEHSHDAEAANDCRRGLEAVAELEQLEENTEVGGKHNDHIEVVPPRVKVDLAQTNKF